ncbi:MAG: calcineurin-like phosphoesterase family protein [Bacteroidales bacterium]|nr:calcineurin-like phosphoesterase family protein [Bacteroidales bacterium]
MIKRIAKAFMAISAALCVASCNPTVPDPPSNGDKEEEKTEGDGTLSQGKEYEAYGYIRYTNGEPAEGVVVSDGFKVTQTKEDGSYYLTTSKNTYYIYFSYPENVKIKKNADGNPDFYKRYSKKTKQYDFELEKQAVETEFALFAMADPQAHYAKRSPQTTADTDRFKSETVPALNKEISEQPVPCYGVTLGDIVYSEGSRNSVPGMKTMRSHFKNVNMPVFQTMGNHDFTYFYSNNPLTADVESSSTYLRAQREFESVFGPINFSFNRGNVHVVCMRNITYTSDTDASKYEGSFSSAQYSWLKADLAKVPKTKMVILCVHIPIVGITKNENVENVLNLIKQYPNSTIFSGHTHYKRGVPNVLSTGMFEHIHSAVCGQWWWSDMEGDGCPNGYTIYRIGEKGIKDEHFMGVNEDMNSMNYQMRIYRGNLTTGGSHAKFKWPHSSGRLLINVFNGDSRWKVEVYENDVLSGTATSMSASKQTFSSVSAGSTYDIDASSSQDWWSIGYHIGVVGRGLSGTSYYTANYHMYKYDMKDPSASVKVVATDGYGNKYTCTEVISEDLYYPPYVSASH